jgi:undecaprenyl-diphosphatase
MEEELKALVLGLVQGASEFLPISSSGHLYLVPKLLGWGGLIDSLTFDVALHIGTTIAVILFFWRDWMTLIGAFFRVAPQGAKAVWEDDQARLLVLIAIGSIPAAILGFLLQDFFENEARNVALVASMLIIFAIVLYAADRLGKQERDESTTTLHDALIIGLAQSMALVPGVSRSGITISAGLFRGMDRRTAARFSFLLGTPTTVGACLLKLKDILSSSEGGSASVLVVGIVTSFIAGFIAIKFLLRYVQTHDLRVFVGYRIALGVAVLLVSALGR